MGWFSRWLQKKCRQAWEEDRKEAKIGLQPLSTNRLQTHGMNFTVYRADGGYVVEYHQYDRKNDDSNHNLYIIAEGCDLGAELGRILTLESLRR